MAYAGYFRQSGRQGATAPVEEAVALLQKIVAQAPQHRRALRLLGMSFGRLQNYDDACAALDRANALPGGDSEALVIKAALHFTATGRYSEAEEAVARSLGIRVNGRAQSVDALLKLAWRGDLEGAAQAVALWPAWLLLEDRGAATAAEVAIWRRDWERALTVLRSVPRDYLSDYYFSGPKSVLMAIAHEMGRQPEAARREWENVKAVTTRMAAADPLAREFVLWKACALAKLGDTEEARRLYHDLEQTGDLRSAFWSCTSPAVLLATTLGTPGPIATKAGLDWRGIKLSAVGDAPRSALELNPVFDPVRATPAFQRLIESAPAPVPASSQPTVTLTAPAQPGGKSVAVLAFKNVGGDPANEAIVEGIGLELISVLGRVPGLTVRGNSSLNYFKGSAATTQEKGRKLNATYLVDGSVQRRGDTVNIVANLTLASTDEVVWSSPSLRREVKDIFAVQDEIARLIAENLSLKLGVRSASATAAINPLAFELYVQARHAWNLRTPEGHARAEQLLNRALALEPNFAKAHAAMADVWSVGAPNGDELSLYTGRIAPEAARVEEKVKLALTLDPGSAEAHASLGYFYYTTWRRVDAERELREAIRLNPSYASAHQWFGRLLLLNGRMEEALVELRQATELDPLSPRILDNYAWALIFAGRFAEAIQYCDRALALQDSAMQARALKAVALALLGRLEEAVVLALTLPAVDSGYSMFRAIVYGLAGKTTELEKALPGYEKGAHISKIAGLAAARRYAGALDALDPNWIVSGSADYLLFHPIFDPMRNDVRFKRALQTLGLTEAHARAQAWRAAHPRPILPVKK